MDDLITLPWPLLAFLALASLPVTLALLFPIAIQINRGGWWRIVAPITLLALLIDVLANYTTLALVLWDWPRAGEYTFSDRLVRLTRQTDWRGDVARDIAVILNRIDPLHNHIK
jgi:hypothetical protein